MHRSSAKSFSALVVSVLAGFFLVSSSALLGADKVEKKTAGKYTLKTYFPTTSVKVSAPLRDHLIRPQPRTPGALKEGPDQPPRITKLAGATRPHDPSVKSTIHPPSMPDPIADFEGIAQFESDCGCLPPDTNAAVGPNDVIQIVNSAFEVFDKDGNSESGGPVAINSLWVGFGGNCEIDNDGDPIVKYDQLSQRWVISQFTAFAPPPNLQCFAVSTSSDPLGTYFQSSYSFGNILNDYPKISIMPEAYYLTVRQFNAASGSAVVALDRAAMVAGDPATAIFFDINQIYSSDVFLAADMQGTNPPPVGSAESIIGIGNPDYDGWPSSVLHFIQMTPNFEDPPSTGITNFDLDVDAFEPAFNNAPQPEGSPALEVLPFPMYTPNYRNFGDHDALVFTHDVDAGGGRVGRRWYEVRAPLAPAPAAARPTGSPQPNIYQQGTFAPDDGLYRWMGSAALDFVGNIAMGYSVSSVDQFPSIWYTGRLPGDPLGEMSQGENSIIEGTGTQQFGNPRWGDYSSLVTDPSDECTFWYTTEYIETTGPAPWQTRIGSFKFPSCSIGPTGGLRGTVTDGTNPLAGVKVTANAASTVTNAAGEYTFTLPIGTYDMTASKYGYLPGSANGVVVTDGGDTVQDFTLSVAPSVIINGVVKDGSGGGWPLYAKVVIKATGAPTFTLYTDPVTGYYSQMLVTGIPYTFQVNALIPGYLPGGGVVPLGPSLAPTATVVNWDLLVDSVSCNALGYSFPPGTLFEPFESGSIPAGWTQDNFSGGGIWRFPATASGDGCANSGSNKTGGSGGFAVLDSDCDGLIQDDVALNTPSLDFSGVPSPILKFNSDYIDLDSVADVDISTNGGADWTNVWERAGADDPGPSNQQIDLSGIAGGQADVRARFHFQGFWAWWWAVDNVLMGDPEAVCGPLPGGMVVGNVTSANGGAGLNGATVENLTNGGSAKTFPTPADPAQPDGLYFLFSESGSNDLKASLSLYGSDQHNVLVIPNAAVRQNFVLQSGSVSATPSPLNGRVDPAGTDNQVLTLSNTGGAAAAFEIVELNAPALTNKTSGFVSSIVRQQALARLGKSSSGRPDLAHSAKGLAPLPTVPHPGRPMAAGDVIASYPTGLAGGWGVLSSGAAFWLSNIAGLGGDEFDYEYDSTTGAQTGNKIDNTGWVGAGGFTADGTYDVSTGMMWQVNVGGDNCIYELDPAAHVATGNKICGSPWTGTSQRGLAYDLVNNAFFIGGWNEGIIYHIDTTGAVIDSANVGLSISGLAYAPSTGHLFVMSNTDGVDVTVLDALNNYAVVGSFKVSDNAFGAFQQAGLEFDCLGNLWAVNQATQVVYNISAGEVVGCTSDITWLTEDPTSGVLGASSAHNGSASSQPIAVTWTGGSLLPGLRQAQLQIKTDTPVPVPAVPVTITVRFLDVPDNNQFEAFIYGAAGAGIMMGGPPNCPAGILDFCPNNVVTRADMAGYIFRAVHGANTPPPVYTNIYGDVTFNQYNSFYIQGITDDGITAGCGNGNYCPDSPNTRAQMSVFIWKGQWGDVAPPACVEPGAFTDVPCGSFAADFIYGLFNEGVTAGCGGGNFCPNANITNGQMSVFLVKGFNIPHL
jgi:hypothetical protein